MSDTSALQAAAQLPRAATRQRADAALAALADEGADITFQVVARRAGVSRQWLYRQPDLRAEIEQLRERSGRSVPVSQRASDASLHQRLRTVLDENRALREEIGELKHELALAYGRQRWPACSPEVGQGAPG